MITSIQVLQALHMHTGDGKVSAVSLQDAGKSVHHDVGAPEVKCSVCEHFTHQQSYLHQYDAVSLTYYPVRPIILSVNYADSLYFTAVHTWTNKGPPLV
jgi:hypothetical protein